MKNDGLCLHLAVLDVHLVAGQHDWNVFADAHLNQELLDVAPVTAGKRTHQISVPVGHVLVRDARRDVEHDDGALALNVIAVAEAAEFFLKPDEEGESRRRPPGEEGTHLSGGIPDVEPDGPSVGVKHERVNFHAEGGDVLLLELSGQVALHERRLARAAVADEHELEGGHFLFSGHPPI
jgi:hypothetical protein